jgi:hypothetical protein
LAWSSIWSPLSNISPLCLGYRASSQNKHKCHYATLRYAVYCYCTPCLFVALIYTARTLCLLTRHFVPRYLVVLLLLVYSHHYVVINHSMFCSYTRCLFVCTFALLTICCLIVTTFLVCLGHVHANRYAHACPWPRLMNVCVMNGPKGPSCVWHVL